jgi:hypothetical protein
LTATGFPVDISRVRNQTGSFPTRADNRRSWNSVARGNGDCRLIGDSGATSGCYRAKETWRYITKLTAGVARGEPDPGEIEIVLRLGIGPGRHPVSAEMTESPRRFPAPWTIEETEACFIVRDHNG